MPPQKRARGRMSNSIPKATWPVGRGRDEPQTCGQDPKRLATPNPQGVHHRPSQGPSFQQGRAVEPAEGQPALVEGNVEAKVLYPICSADQQQQQRARVKKFPFPKKFKPVHKALLASTPPGLVRWGDRPDQVQALSGHRTRGVGRVRAPCGTVAPRGPGRTRSRSCSATTAAISSRAANRSTGTARNDLLNAVGSRPSGCKEADEKHGETQKFHDRVHGEAEAIRGHR